MLLVIVQFHHATTKSFDTAVRLGVSSVIGAVSHCILFILMRTSFALTPSVRVIFGFFFTLVPLAPGYIFCHLHLLLLIGCKLLHPFNGLFFRTTWVSQYQKGKTSLDLNEARDDGVWG